MDDLTGARGRRRSHRRRSAAGLAATFLVALTVIGPVSAAPAARVGGPPARLATAEVADLARRAATDDAALAELRAVRSIDGRSVDLRAATAALGTQRASRLRALAAALQPGGAPTSSTVTPEVARRRARQILDQSRYQKKEPPKPFAGVLRWLGDRLDPVLGPIRRFFSSVFDTLARIIPGGGIVVAVLVAGIATTLVVLLVMRRSGARITGAGGARSLLVDLGADPTDLDREAADAEAAGDLDLAVRRRYEAGLVRLARAGRITVAADTTASRVAAAVGGEAIVALTRTFERVVYGRIPATAADVAEARNRWVEVVGVGARR